MAGTSDWSCQMERLKLSDGDCAVGGPSESEFVRATAATQGEDGPSTSPEVLSAESGSMGGGTESGQGRDGASGGMSVEDQIERSKSHWSLLTDQSDSDNGRGEVSEESNVQVFNALQLHPTWGRYFRPLGRFFRVKECAEVSNVQVFQSLQRNPTWGFFFLTFGGDGLRGNGFCGELVVGEKFAEGGQAELFHAQVNWWDPKDNEYDREKGREWVVKVFKKGTFLRHLQRQLPRGYLQFHAREMERWYLSPTPNRFPRFFCHVDRGTLLRDGRFAFLMVKEHFDLRTLIERNMRSGKECGPFSKEEAELIMYHVAMGMEWLHSHDIVHRDLKASNVLVKEFKSGWPKCNCFVADYECSVGVVGTGFFRAPEILQACKEGKTSQRPEVFSKEADVYSYGMTCYEILTGKLPFQGHPANDYDLVLNGERPVVPEYVEDWMRELLRRCWQVDERARPTFGEILDLLVAKSEEVGRYYEVRKREYGERWPHSLLSKS